MNVLEGKTEGGEGWSEPQRKREKGGFVEVRTLRKIVKIGKKKIKNSAEASKKRVLSPTGSC